MDNTFTPGRKMPLDENYYGLGDKAGPMNRRNRAFTNWNTDEFGCRSPAYPLYKTIPFFIGLRKGTAYGVFLRQHLPQRFDFGKESQDYLSFAQKWGAELLFFAGPKPKQIIQEYTAMTGRSRCLPSDAGLPAKPLFVLSGSRAREIVKLSAKRKYPRTPSIRHRLSAGQCAFHDQPGIFPDFREK